MSDGSLDENGMNANNANVVREMEAKWWRIANGERGFESKGLLLNVRRIGNERARG